ncbi:MAG: SusD/RagB family nutrient-binding outer membrane lipoprotein [Bacteroidota bacterium]
MKSLYKSSLFLLALLLMQACTQDFGEINSNPNAPENVTGGLLLPTIIINPAQRLGRLGWEEGNTAMQISAVNNFTTFDQMGWGGQDGVWNDMYRGIRDADNLMIIADESGNTAFKGVAMIMKAWMGATLADFFGDVPYSQANKAKDDNFTPAYDAQEDVYNTILSELETAEGLLAQGGSIDGDPLFSGDLLKWRKFANSLRIRYLMRLEKKRSGASIGPAIQAIVSSGIHFESNEDGASVPYLTTAPNQYFQHTGRVGGFDEHRLSQKAEERMKAINDPRLFVFYRPIGNPDSLAFYFDPVDLDAITKGSGTNRTAFRDFFTTVYAADPMGIQQYYPLFKGLPNGLSEGNAINYNGSRQNQSRLGEILRELPDGVSMHFMHYPELMFILAEAAQKDYINGNAADFYQAGIEAAFEMYGIEAADSYYTQSSVVLSNDNDTALEQIATQKWISLFVSGIEAYFDWRRTGLPEITPGPDNVNNNQVPLRFNYPAAEQALNGDNWKAAVDRIGGDDNINAVMWLLQ